MSHQSLARILVVAIPALALACAAESGEEGAGQAALPDTTAAAVWAHLENEAYEQNWALWPGKGRLYSGGEPHGMLLTTYVNEAALQAVNGRTGSLPVGAIVVKENYMPDSTLAAVTIMYKAQGFNPEHNDWYFIKRLASGQLDTMPGGVPMAGRVPGCQNCHGAARQNDYILTSSLTQ